MSVSTQTDPATAVFDPETVRADFPALHQEVKVRELADTLETLLLDRLSQEDGHRGDE